MALINKNNEDKFEKAQDQYTETKVSSKNKNNAPLIWQSFLDSILDSDDDIYSYAQDELTHNEKYEFKTYSNIWRS